MDEIIEMAKYMAEAKTEEEYQEWVSELATDLEAIFGYWD
jgi:hypothetical protein